jgi:hypothetical protein
MAVPEGLSLERHRDLVGREQRPIVREVLLGLLCLVLLLGLLNIFGQVRSVDVAETAAARFEVDAPSKVRGGLFFQARFEIEAVSGLRDATVVLHPDWLEDITLNTVEPAPVGEASRDGWIAFELGRVPRGDKYIFYLQFQVNPTAVGVRSQDVELYDGDRRLTSFDRTLVIWP